MIRYVFLLAMLGCVTENTGTDRLNQEATLTSDAIIAPASPIRVSLPLHDAFNNNVFPAAFLSTTGGPGSTLGLVVQIPMLPVGATILEVDARVRDSSTGPTKVYLSLAEQVDNGFQEPAVQPGALSTGAGTQAFQTITLPNLNRLVQPFHVYYAGVFVATGTQPVAVSAIDLTYQPAP